MKSFFTLILVAFISLSFGQKQKTEAHFGFSLMPSHSGGLITYYVVYTKGDKISGTVPLNKEEFVKQVTGHVHSKANEKHKNLFKENQIENCYVLYDAEMFKHDIKKYVGFECPCLDNLWKIRYKKHPYDHQKNDGWSKSKTGYAPSGSQFGFLKKYYNVLSVSGIFYGENMWKLLRDMQDEEFKDFYIDSDLTWKSVVPSKDKKPEEKKDKESTKPEAEIKEEDE